MSETAADRRKSSHRGAPWRRYNRRLLLRALALTLALLGGARPCTAGDANAAAPIDPNRFERQVVVAAAVDPMQFDIAPDGRVFFIERGGAIKLCRAASADANAGTVVEIGRLEVGLFGEVGLMGLALPHDFVENPRLFVMYCPAKNPRVIRVSALPLVGETIDLTAEDVLLEYPIDMDFAVHMGGGLAMSDRGELFIGTGDNTIPIPELPLDERPGKEHLDARRSSGNTQDLRGKILRIKPNPAGGYAIPPGNLFSDGREGRPEIYAMGCRNPFRIFFDNLTRELLWGDVGPNISMSVPIGPNGYDEINATTTPGNFGWPFCVGPNEPYRDYDFATGELGELFNPDQPINDSRNNTGAERLPPARPAFLWYPSTESAEFPELGTGGRSAMCGPTYRVLESQQPQLRLPEHYDRALFIHDWTRNWIKAVWRDADGAVQRIEPFMAHVGFRKPIQLKLAADGTLYVLEFGDKWFDNRDAQLVRIVYRRGNRPPEPKLRASVAVGKAPLITKLDATETIDRDGDQSLNWAWRVDGKVVEDAAAATLDLTLTETGRHHVEVAVTDSVGATATATTEVCVGNAQPEVRLTAPEHGSFFDWAQLVKFRAAVIDEEDGSSVARTIPDAAVTVRATYQQRRRGEADEEQQAPGLALMRRSTCFSCHATSSGGGGPAYVQVARKYAGDPEAVTRLAQKVVAGGAGAWGEKAMPAHPQHSVEQAEKMVEWVLGLATDRTRQVYSGHDGVFLAPEAPPHRGDAGVLLIEAEYRDLGAGEIPPATGAATAVLHTRRKKPGFADKTVAVEIIDVFEGEGALVGFFKDGGYVTFNEMRLDSVRKVRIRGLSIAGNNATIEMRVGGPTGEVIGHAILPSEGYGEVDVPLSAPSGTHDLCVIARSPNGASASVAAVNWLEFDPAPPARSPTKVVVAALATESVEAAGRLQIWCDLLAKTFNQLDDVAAIVSPDADWPTDQRLIADSRVVVLCRLLAEGDDFDAIPPSIANHVELMRRLGVGVFFVQLSPGSDAEVTSLEAIDSTTSAPTGGPPQALEQSLLWPRCSSAGTAWLGARGGDNAFAIAWAEAPPDSGRRIRFAAPPDPSALLKPAVRDGLLRGLLWCAWRDGESPPATWLDSTSIPSPTNPAQSDAIAESPSPAPRDFLSDVPGGWVMPPAASEVAERIDRLFWIIAGVSISVAVPVTLATGGFVWAYRSRVDRPAQKTANHNVWLEAGWSTATGVVLAGIFYAGLIDYVELTTPPDECYEIDVSAQKWSWSFRYPGGYIDPDLHVPAGRPIRLLLSSSDVIHSLYIPAFRLKMDCVPGRYSTAWFEATEPTPPGQSHPLLCAEYCGTSHSQMLARVVVHNGDEFNEWLANAADLTRTLPPVDAGRLLYERRGCQQCHSIDGSIRNGGGPSFLGSFGSEQTVNLGDRITIDENYLRESMINPMAKVRSGYRPVMPTYQGQLRDPEIDAIVAFIKSLAEGAKEKDE